MSSSSISAGVKSASLAGISPATTLSTGRQGFWTRLHTQPEIDRKGPRNAGNHDSEQIKGWASRNRSRDHDREVRVFRLLPEPNRNRVESLKNRIAMNQPSYFYFFRARSWVRRSVREFCSWWRWRNSGVFWVTRRITRHPTRPPAGVRVAILATRTRTRQVRVAGGTRHLFCQP